MADKTIGIEASDGNFYNVKLRDMGGGLWAPVNSASISDYPALAATAAGDHVSLEGQDATYSCTVFLTPDSTSSSQDLCGLEPSATMVTRLLHVRFWPRQTTASLQLFFLQRRATLNSGGTSAVTAGVLHRTTDPASTAQERHWTVKPAAMGTNLGGIKASYVFVPAITGTTQGEVVVDWDFRQGGGRLPTLEANSTAAFYLQWFGAMPAGGVIAVEWNWTESAT